MIIKKLHPKNNPFNNKYKLCYIGFRPLNTLKLHEKFAGLNTYQYNFKRFKKLDNTNTAL